MYQPRGYRNWVKDTDLLSFRIVVEETDLLIRAGTNLKSRALKIVIRQRNALKKYIEHHPLFLTTLQPFPVEENAPAIVKVMSEAGTKAGVGPMAAVAGAIADFAGAGLSDYSPDVIVENGGDIYIKSLHSRVVGIFAGNSPLTGKIGVEVKSKGIPLGVSTSSGTVGHSLSFGKADAVVVLAESAALSDAVATAVGNLIKEPENIPDGIEFARSIECVKGAIIIIGDKMGAWGEVNICATNPGTE